MVLQETFRADQAGSVLRLAGEIDIVSAPRLVQAVESGSGDLLCVDMRDVPFMDSTGAHVLADAARTRSGRGCVIIHEPQPHVARVFELLGLTRDGSNIHLIGSNGSA
jgi:anti-anti-sigma factor